MLVDVDIPASSRPLPAGIKRFLTEADLRIEANLAEASSPAFIPSDATAIATILLALHDSPLLRGPSLCEWGSGLGVNATTASLIGYDAYGIECDPLLIQESRRLADDFQARTIFVQGSFLPNGVEPLLARVSDTRWLQTSAKPAYAKMGLEIADFDTIIVYPWPDDEDFTWDLFDEFAGDGAILLTYRGNGCRLKRKVSRKTRRPR